MYTVMDRLFHSFDSSSIQCRVECWSGLFRLWGVTAPIFGEGFHAERGTVVELLPGKTCEPSF
jgi:hypothetical protein